jgi:hypothetical protein
VTTREVVTTSLHRDWLLVGAIIARTALRFYQLSEQIIADDDWHALQAARDLGSSIAMHFGGSDVSIPMALYDKVVMGTVGLSEWLMRAPVVFFGLLALVCFPLILRALFDRTTKTLFGWLLAISPVHILLQPLYPSACHRIVLCLFGNLRISSVANDARPTLEVALRRLRGRGDPNFT